MFARHCSDEQLLAHLDGELGWLAALRVRRHLVRCWHCRTRLAAFEAEVHALLERIDSAPLPARHIDAARRRFFARPEVAEVRFARDRDAGPPRRWRLARVGVALALSISAFAWWRYSLPPRAPADTRPNAPKAFVPPSAAAAALSEPTLPRPPLLTVPPWLPVPPAAPAPDLDALELRVLYALHRAHSCLGEGIEVVRTAEGGIAVRGLVSSPRRRDEIVSLLELFAESNAVEVQLHTLAEMPASRLDQVPPAGGLEQVDAASPAGPSTIPMEPLLLARYRSLYPDVSAEARERRVIDLSNHVLRLAGRALAHAWALRNFAALYPPERLGRLNTAGRTLAREVVEEHTADLNAACSELAARLEGQLDFTPAPAGAAPFATWQEAAEATLAQMRELHADASDLFSCGHLVTDVPERAARLVRALGETRRVASGIQSARLAP